MKFKKSKKKNPSRGKSRTGGLWIWSQGPALKPKFWT